MPAQRQLISRQSCHCCHPRKRRCFSTSAITRSSPSTESRDSDPSRHNELSSQLGRTAREKLANREFFFNLLSTSTTKREAKAYLSRFKPPHTKSSSELIISKKNKQNVRPTSSRPEVNMGSLFAPPRAVEESPVFAQSAGSSQTQNQLSEIIHVALVKLKDPHNLDDGVLKGICQTLSQLSRLGMGCCVVVDTASRQPDDQWRQVAVTQAHRVAAAIDSSPGSGARVLDNIIGVPSPMSEPRVLYRKLLLSPLRRGQIPVIVPIGYTEDAQTVVRISANDTVLAVTKEFAGLGHKASPDEDPKETAKQIRALQSQISLDRLIILDELGGIPSADRPDISHVFINIEQEFDDIRDELSQYSRTNNTQLSNSDQVEALETFSPSMTGSRLFSIPKMVERPARAFASSSGRHQTTDTLESPTIGEGHLANLRLLKQSLSYLPPSSSALLTTPQEAAESGRSLDSSPQVSAVGTRRQRNPLIHNLLTDKPAYSSSLPLGRLGMPNGSQELVLQHSPSTFVKRGMPLTILPDPRIKPWTAENHGEPRLTLNDPRIDLPRLVNLIEDSFNRKLDVEHYLRRVNDRIAGLIVAGEYEGGALLTWETPPGVPDDNSETTLSRQVPYLDKFAVLKRSQGAGGVADIVFNAMVRGCFPSGVCWRSRRDNPVNKWYFERARGTWKMPNTKWTMFWTTEGVVQDRQTFLDYEGVCRTVEPSWADNKAVVD